MFHGKLLAIAIARQAKGPMEHVESIEAVAGEGLMGDRYGAGIGAAQFKGRRKPENEVDVGSASTDGVIPDRKMRV